MSLLRTLVPLSPGLLAAAGLLLSACSSSPGASDAAAPAAGTPAGPPAAAALPYGARVDSLNGVPGHPFGEGLARFPGLQRNEGGTPDQLIYRWPDGNPHQWSWFAKHQADVPGVFYTFQGGRFARFQAIAYAPAGQAALEGEARYLFGPGRELGGGRVEWVGQRAGAVLSSGFLNGRAIRELDIYSLPLQAELAQQQQARLRAENAPGR